MGKFLAGSEHAAAGAYNHAATIEQGGVCRAQIKLEGNYMAGYGVKEARINKERKPKVNTCGTCGAECDSLLCDDCMGEIAASTNYADIGRWESEGEEARRTR